MCVVAIVYPIEKHKRVSLLFVLESECHVAFVYPYLRVIGFFSLIDRCKKIQMIDHLMRCAKILCHKGSFWV